MKQNKVSLISMSKELQLAADDLVDAGNLIEGAFSVYNLDITSAPSFSLKIVFPGEDEVKDKYGIIKESSISCNSYHYETVKSKIVESDLAPKEDLEKIYDDILKFLKSKKPYIKIHESKFSKTFLIAEPDTNNLKVMFAFTFDKTSPLCQRFLKIEPKLTEYRLNSLVTKSIEYYINTSWNGFPSIYDNDFDVQPISNPGLYKIDSGDIIYLPAITKEDFTAVIKQIGDTSLPRNKILSLNDNSKVMTYFNSDSVQSTYMFTRAIPVSSSDIASMLDRNYDYLFSTSGSGLASYYNWTAYTDLSTKYSFMNVNKGSLNEEVAKNLNISSDRFTSSFTTIGDVIHQDGERFKEFLTELMQACEEKYKVGSISPVNYLKLKGSILLLQQCSEDAINIKINETKQQIAFENVNSDDLPSLCNVNTDISLFPHQGSSIAKLNVAGENAILDVSTGGGKTPSIIYDICNLLNKGKIKRPLVSMPTSLIPQWISQVTFFTAGKMNAFPITTEVVNRRGKDEIEKMIRSAPPNTIFLTTYSFLTTGKYIVDPIEEVYSYTGMEWVRSVVNPDYISLDESHFIKRPTTDWNLAATNLGSTCIYKRIATGTLINNNPTDLIGQCGFLDPSIVGDTTEFKNRYSEGGVWRPNFAELCRNDLRSRAKYIMFRKKDWAVLLPKIQYNQVLVEMSKEQAKIYKDMVYQVLEEIKSDPNLAKAWDKLISSGDDGIDVPVALLGKLARLEQYLTAPEIHGLTKLVGEEWKSPKLEAIDNLIDESIKQGGKVIVNVHYKEAARHLQKYSRHSARSVYYDAANKKAVPEFQNNPKIVVMFAVCQSLKEGLNLQVANRIIVADVDWTPGNLDQLEARIVRPHLEWKDGKLINKNSKKIVYIDTVICNDSADVVKYAFQNFKKIRNAKIMENCPIDMIDPPQFSDEALVARYGDPLVGGVKSMQATDAYRDWILKQIEDEKKKGDLSFVPVKESRVLPNSAPIKNIPWVSGMTLPLNNDDDIPLIDYAESKEEYTAAKHLTAIEDDLIGKTVITEYGFGIIKGVTSNNKVKILNYDTNKTKSFDMFSVVINEKITPANAKKLQAKENSKDKLKTKLGVKPIDAKNALDLEHALLDLPTGKVTRSKLNELLSKYNKQLKVKTVDGEKEYRVYDSKYDLTSKPINIEDVSDKSWEQWLKYTLKLDASITKHIEKKSAAEKVKTPTEKVKTPKVEKTPKTDEPVKDGAAEIYIGIYNGILCLYGYTEDPDSEDLLDLGFKDMPPCWSFYVGSKAKGYIVLEKLQKKYKIPAKNVEEIEAVFDNMARSKYKLDFPEEGIRNWMKLNRKKAAAGQLKLYPMVIDEYVYLIVDTLSHPGVTLSRYGFEKEDKYFVYFGKSPSDVKQCYKRIKSKLRITNDKTLIKDAKDSYNISLR